MSERGVRYKRQFDLHVLDWLIWRRDIDKLAAYILAGWDAGGTRD